jgi:Lipase (class 3)
MIHLMNWLKGTSTARSLPEKQRRMYTSEQTDNFRLIAKLFAVHSSHTLTSEDLASSDLQCELAEIGQFAEVAHGTVSPAFIWEHMESLMQPQFPLDGYDALRGSKLIDAFRGTVAELQCYIAYRPPTKQLIIAFSGTSSVSQTFRNIDARLVAYPGGERCAVHAGFWRLYNGVRSRVLSELDKALTQYNIEEIICTGHSMGAVMCYLLALDIMGADTAEGASQSRHPITLPLKLALFGSPRVGNQALAELWRRLVANRNAHGLSVKEYSVMCYNDGQIYRDYRQRRR